MRESKSCCGGKVTIGAASAIFIFLDRLSKWYIFEHLPLGESRVILPGVLSMTSVANRGAAFGLLPERSAFFTLTAIVVVAAILFFLALRGRTLRSNELLAFVLILSGTAGNLWDRLKTGYIIDFIDFGFWPVFNFADIYITLGAVILMGCIALRNH